MASFRAIFYFCLSLPDAHQSLFRLAGDAKKPTRGCFPAAPASWPRECGKKPPTVHLLAGKVGEPTNFEWVQRKRPNETQPVRAPVRHGWTTWTFIFNVIVQCEIVAPATADKPTYVIRSGVTCHAYR